VLVQSVFNNTAAQTMGLMAGDVILTVNGAQIASMTDLRNEVALNQVGDPVEVTVERQGQQLTSTGQFQTWPSNIPYEPIDPGMEQNFRNWQENRLNQMRQDVDDLSKQVDGLQKQLTGTGADGVAGAGAGAGTGVYTGPAWHFAYGISSRSAAISTQVASSGPVGDPAVDLGIAVPVDWRFAWGISSTPAAAHPIPHQETP
jgi:membrane-associated protease RseP (regulator of RpoE activity)